MEEFIAQLRTVCRALQGRKRREFDRQVPFGDPISERSESVDQNIPAGMKARGMPARIIGTAIEDS